MKKITTRDRKNSNSLMKNVLDDIVVKTLSSQKKEKWSLRDFVWNYPILLSRLFKTLIPISYILLFAVLGFFLVIFFQSETFVKLTSGQLRKHTYTEGVVGVVNSLNPIFVSNNYLDRALHRLIFEKFIYIDKEGNPTPGIASKWEISDKGLTVDFTIDDGHYWQSGERVTVDDVIFTFETAIKLSDQKGVDSVGASLEGVVLEKTGEDSVRFKLKEANAVFFQAVSIFILPKEYFGDMDIGNILYDNFSRYPIGSGKYKVTRNESNTISLEDNEFDSSNPDIKKIIFMTFANTKSLEQSFRTGSLDAISGWDEKELSFVEEYTTFKKYHSLELNRIKLLFFNIRKDSLKSKEMRMALNYLFNKVEFLKELGSGGQILKGPIPSFSWAYNSNIETYEYNAEKGAELLKGLGYVKNEKSGFFESKNGEILRFTVTYLDNPTNERLVSLLEKYYEKEGIYIKKEKFNYMQMTQEVLATRDYEIILYEIEITRDPDQYNLWHSLKVDYPDLNLSGYSSERVDIYLEEGRQTTNLEQRKQKYYSFQRNLMADSPAIFLYNPSFLYVSRKNIENIDLGPINSSFERYYNIEDWHWR